MSKTGFSGEFIGFLQMFPINGNQLIFSFRMMQKHGLAERRENVKPPNHREHSNGKAVIPESPGTFVYQ